MEHHRIATNGIRLHVIEAGPIDGPLLILLHGFPEFWYGWRHQIDALAARGYRVWAPDLRGYNLSDKPEGIEAYRLDALAADVAGLIDASGRGRALLVGHDWGGALAWWVAGAFPERVERMVVINAPHPLVMWRQLRRDPAQLLRSWYVFLFQLPRLPEALARRHDWSWLARALRDSSRPGTFTAEDLALYRQAWSRPGAIRAMLHWYRAALQRPPLTPTLPRVGVPTLLLWGCRDRFLGQAMARESITLCDEGTLHVFEEASHWLHQEEPEAVNARIDGFLRPAFRGST